MSISKFISCSLLVACFLFSGCSFLPQQKPVEKSQEKLTVNVDGSMEFRNRKLPQGDVIIYPDGTGGEKAAVKVYDPLHPDYYRDSIRVERKAEQEQAAPEMH